MKKYFYYIDKFQLIVGFLSYSAGINIVQYLGFSIKPESGILVFIIILLSLLSANLLELFFQFPITLELTPKKKFEERTYLLYVSLGLMALIPVILLFLFRDGFLQVNNLFVILMFFFMVYGNSIPPLRFGYFGWGELVKSVYLSGIIPAIGFLFQQDKLNSIIIFFSMPLFLITTASYIIQNFEKYSKHTKTGERSFVTIFTWQVSIKIHNIVLTISYLILSFFSFLGMPKVIALPILFSLPFAVFQIFYLHLIADGHKPNWKVFIFTSNLTSILAFYFLNLSLTIN